MFCALHQSHRRTADTPSLRRLGGGSKVGHYPKNKFIANFIDNVLLTLSIKYRIKKSELIEPFLELK